MARAPKTDRTQAVRGDKAPDRSRQVPADVRAIDGRPVYQLDTQRPQALVIHCGDPRFQTAFRRFVTEELGIRPYLPIVLGGGIHAFGAQTLLPKNFKVLWQQVKFAVKEQQLSEVIIINHEDCQWYQKLQGYHTRIDTVTKGREDLGHAARLLLSDFAGIRVRTFWAELDGTTVRFEETT